MAIALLTVVATVLVLRNTLWSPPGAQIQVALDPDCDLRAGPCSSVLSDGRAVRLSIEPRSIPPLAPLRLRVDTTGFSADKVSVDLNGIGMQMGFNQLRMNRHPTGYFEATGSLSVCIREVMEWEALVKVESEEAQISVPFRFITVKNGFQP